MAKDNFQRVRLIEAHNSIFNYDLISICETSLNDSVELPETLLNDYTFVSANNPANTRHGGVGLFYKNSLPVEIRNDLSFNESIVIELKFGRKKFIFTVLYRSPASNHASPEFQTFLSNFENLYSNIQAGNPFATFFTGDFDAYTQFWWLDGNTTPEGEKIDERFSKGLSQIISELTNFEPHINPSCIDLIVTDQPNITLESGNGASLDSYCHHQIIHCKTNFRISEEKTRLDAFRIESQQAVESAKLAYLTNLGNKVNDSNTSKKSYWKIINRGMNKCRAPKIPPLLVNNIFILNCREKAKYINDI